MTFLNILDSVGKTEIGRKFLTSVRTFFLKSGTTFAIFNWFWEYTCCDCLVDNKGETFTYFICNTLQCDCTKIVMATAKRWI